MTRAERRFSYFMPPSQHDFARRGRRCFSQKQLKGYFGSLASPAHSPLVSIILNESANAAFRVSRVVLEEERRHRQDMSRCCIDFW
jgi:hypothetical protein